MSRDFIMLTDTAMVLLRQYIQLHDDEDAHLTQLNKETNYAYHDRIYESIYGGGFARDVISALIQDIQTLWLHPDLVPERCLEWHLVLSEDFMRQCRIMFNPSRGSQEQAIRRHASVFVYHLAQEYKKELARRELSKDTDL